ncbi:tautomerase family protein [Undibacterium sp. TJN19]|uniref:tautomerase family protein n=1 Tax=Undibacterium sp. TJN19 TaxID=3413055 RepID=UPI003BF41AC5
MPNILVKIPKASFPAEHRARLMRSLSDAAATAEQIPDDPRMRMMTMIVIDEVDSGSYTFGGMDMTMQCLPCIAVVYVPAGVLDATARALYVQLVHEAFRQAMPAEEHRKLISSIMLHDVVDGTWGVNGIVWTLPDFARAAGYRHLQPAGTGLTTTAGS